MPEASSFRLRQAVLAALFCAAGSLAGAAGPALARETVIPLKPYLAGQATVEATVNGVRGVFLFDTGEGLSSISPQFAKKIGCVPWGQVTGFRMSGERLDYPRCDGIEFRSAGRRLYAPSVMTLDIMKLLGDDVPEVDGALGLDVFAGKTITILPRKAVIIETPESLARRISHAHPLEVRLVREVEGLSLDVDGAVKTPKGLAWMELDTGNGGSFVVANHIAPLLGMPSDMKTPTPERFELENGLVVEGKTRTRDLIMDGNIGAQFLNHWALTLDLKNGRAWLAPYEEREHK